MPKKVKVYKTVKILYRYKIEDLCWETYIRYDDKYFAVLSEEQPQFYDPNTNKII